MCITYMYILYIIGSCLLGSGGKRGGGGGGGFELTPFSNCHWVQKVSVRSRTQTYIIYIYIYIYIVQSTDTCFAVPQLISVAWYNLDMSWQPYIYIYIYIPYIMSIATYTCAFYTVQDCRYCCMMM